MSVGSDAADSTTTETMRPRSDGGDDTSHRAAAALKHSECVPSTWRHHGHPNELPSSSAGCMKYTPEACGARARGKGILTRETDARRRSVGARERARVASVARMTRASRTHSHCGLLSSIMGAPAGSTMVGGDSAAARVFTEEVQRLPQFGRHFHPPRSRAF